MLVAASAIRPRPSRMARSMTPPALVEPSAPRIRAGPAARLRAGAVRALRLRARTASATAARMTPTSCSRRARPARTRVLRALAQRFEGAYPYLALIARVSGDRRPARPTCRRGLLAREASCSTAVPPRRLRRIARRTLPAARHGRPTGAGSRRSPSTARAGPRVPCARRLPPRRAHPRRAGRRRPRGHGLAAGSGGAASSSGSATSSSSRPPGSQLRRRAAAAWPAGHRAGPGVARRDGLHRHARTGRHRVDPLVMGVRSARRAPAREPDPLDGSPARRSPTARSDGDRRREPNGPPSVTFATPASGRPRATMLDNSGRRGAGPGARERGVT